jgi:hypothetical protein
MLGLALLVVVAAVSFSLIHRNPSNPLPPVLILSEPYKIPVTPRDRLALTFPNNRFANRLENAFFGPRKPIAIHSKIFSFTPSQTNTAEHALPLGEPAYTNSTGLRIWIPDRPAFEKSSQALSTLPEIKILAGPNVVTADGIASSFFVGGEVPLKGLDNSVDVSMEFIAHVEDNSVDLVTTISYSELRTNVVVASSNTDPTNSLSVQTNVNVRARLQIPKGYGILFLQMPAIDSKENAFGVLIDTLQ